MPSLTSRDNFIHLDSVSSTNDYAIDLASKGLDEWTVITASKQTNGRGRNGRTWESLEGNLFCSIIAPRSVNHQSILSLLVAVSLGDALVQIGLQDFHYKWPNDIMIEDSKVAGILIEIKPDSYIVIGIGVNIKSSPDLGVYKSASLSEHGFNISPKNLAEAILRSIIINSELEIDEIISKWRKRAWKIGEEICIKQSDKVISGIFSDISRSGNLRLKINQSEELEFISGEVSLRV